MISGGIPDGVEFRLVKKLIVVELRSWDIEFVGASGWEFREMRDSDFNSLCDRDLVKGTFPWTSMIMGGVLANELISELPGFGVLSNDLISELLCFGHSVSLNLTPGNL